jgi:hypothetical protein
MSALVEREGLRAGARQMLGGACPGMARLPAAVQQQHRLARIAVHIGYERIAGCALEHRG